MQENYAPSKIVKVDRPKEKDIWMIRFLICCGVLSMLAFIFWFLDPGHIGCVSLFWLLTFALLFKFLKMLQEWYHYWSPSVPEIPEWKTKWTVDVLTTSCPGEPREMIIRTITAMKNITYSHKNYLCDEGNDPVLKKACEELGIIHVTRTEKKNAKAGNINNALHQATGDICVILDPDHVPVPEFLDRVLPYFEDEKVGYVQCVQAYGNQSESLIARGAAEQSYHFYGPMMMSMNSYGTVQAIGANCTFRRKALDSIGGHAPGLAEDMHTAMQLQAKGWKPVYVPEILSRGLVPATLSSYYKQQLKWSRGCFELLFRTYPSLFKKFSWRQKLHHFLMPLYFLFGLINFIDIIVPLFALGFALVPWEVDLKDFIIHFFPLFGISLSIRFYAQRWLLEKHERGLHLTGGILRMATWWILLVGFIYAILNINVPYIPTPKEDEHRNYWKLCIPNFIIVLVCGITVYYGLRIDWTPYSIAMGSFAFINSLVLIYAALISQQKILFELKEKLRKINFAFWLNKKINDTLEKIVGSMYVIIRGVPAVLFIGAAALLLGYDNTNKEIISRTTILELKQSGGFFLGKNISEKNNLDSIISLEKKIKNSFDIISFNSDFGAKIPEELLKNISTHGSIPFLNWNFFSNGKIFIAKPSDSYLEQCADIFQNYDQPVFINLVPGFERKEIEKNNAEEFISTWQYIYLFFSRYGISNITWVWSPQSFPSEEFYPGNFFVDWINSNSSNYDFRKFKKPVLLSVSENINFTKEELASLINTHKEIRALILNGKNISTDLTELLNEKPFSEKAYIKSDFKFLRAENKNHIQNCIAGKQKHYKLLVHGKPFYIKGIAYNTGHDWRDGNVPLTRRQLKKDFSLIKKMGANTIRRYGSTFYDNNILSVAEEYDLKVLYGFFFDTEIDYYRDSSKVKNYIEEVENTVLKFKDYPAILGWSIGNETWGLLKKKFSKPYLVKVREHYVKMIELITQRIHVLDPNHPVITCMEDGGIQLAGEIKAFHYGAPSLDAIGINSYYKENISRLDSLVSQIDPARPYIVSEFGPNGYWDDYYNKLSNGTLIEQNEIEKANWYKTQWKNFIEPNKGKNLGGFAYCWKDRMEATNTWFGLTDYKGRTKPSYYTLKEVWNSFSPNKKMNPLVEFTIYPLSIVPEKKYVFTAISSENKNQDLKYEWQLNKDDYLEKINSLEYSSNENTVILEIPRGYSKYRLYLYVSDKNGNVSTASYPINFK